MNENGSSQKSGAKSPANKPKPQPRKMPNGNQTPAVATAEDNKRKRQDKKLGKRAMQIASMERKAAEEDKYFRECQREAAKQRAAPTGGDSTARQVELFGTQQAQGINFAKYDDIKVEVKKGSGQATAGTGTAFTSFDQLSLDATIRRNVTLMNYSTPTPIQRHAIPSALAGEDLMCCAQTGSGKTCAFLLPVCAQLVKEQPKLNGKGASPRCVVLAPTRELAIQIELEAQKICYEIPFLRPVAVYGGANQRKQIRDLAFGADIVVATPGRLTDFVDRSLITLDCVSFLVLDEADRMLDMGFEPQIRKLILESGMTSKEDRQTLMFSATFPPKIQTLAGAFLRTYTWIAVGRVGSTTDNISQVLIQATPDKREKLKLVVEALQKGPTGRTLIFVQKKRTATWVKNLLCKGGPSDGGPDERFDPIPAEDIHGDRSQPQREAALAAFRSGKCRVLVATDVAARGLDIGGVEHVINMDLPTAMDEFDSYVHRIGRTGRAGHTGLATSLYVPGEALKVGNGKIANQLVVQLREAKQDVPNWLEAECAGGGARSTGGGGRGAIGTDVRNISGGRSSRGRGGGRERGGRSSDGRRSGRDGGGGRGGEGGGRSSGGRGREGGRGNSRPAERGRGRSGGGGRSGELKTPA
jgi:ATP-dependent RNA helicase DDX3X